MIGRVRLEVAGYCNPSLRKSLQVRKLGKELAKRTSNYFD